MEELFRQLAAGVALGIEVVAVLVVTLGSVEAFAGIARTLVPGSSTHGRKKEIWRRFGTWLLLGLEFELAADIVQSVIAPSWVDIGQLGAIAVIRTFLNYFLEKDLEHAESSGEVPGGTRTLAATTALILACGLGSRPAYAQPSPPDLVVQAAGTEAALVELRRQIEVMAAELASLRAAIDELRAKTPSLAAGFEQRLTSIEETVQRMPELASDVSDGFPGALPIPGTDMAVKVGGQARMTLVHSLAPIGTDDRFVTSSIPVGDEQPGEQSRTVYSPIASRVSLDVRRPSGIGSLRTFIESDFAGTSNTFRLRHAFMQTSRWIFGQTWSTFTDRETEPLGIDFEGLNAISLFRQPQIRYTRGVPRGLTLAVSVENPSPELTGADGVALVPDIVTRLRWDAAGDGARQVVGRSHMQVAGLVRQLRGESDAVSPHTVSTGGFGLNVDGVLIPRWARGDKVKFAANAGWGIGSYIKDLDEAGGQDAVYDSSRDVLRALLVSSGYIGYERRWRPTLLSAFTYGLVSVNNLATQTADSLHRTYRTSVNLTWTPAPNADLILELLAGRRRNKDGGEGTSGQVQAGWTVRF